MIFTPLDAIPSFSLDQDSRDLVYRTCVASHNWDHKEQYRKGSNYLPENAIDYAR